MKFFASLRSRIFLAILLAVVPLLIFVIDGYRRERAAAIAAIDEDIRILLRSALMKESEVANTIHLTLRIMSNANEMKDPTPEGCTGLAQRLMQSQLRFTIIGAVRADGSIFCSSHGAPSEPGYADRAWFREALATHSFSKGYYIKGRLSGQQTVGYGLPQLSDAGEVRMVLFAGVPLDWFNQVVEGMHIPPGWHATVVTEDGTVATEVAPGAGPHVHSTEEILHILGAPPREPVVRQITLPGGIHLAGVAPLSSTHGLYLMIGTDAATALAPVNQRFGYQLLLILAVVLLSLLIAWRSMQSVIDWTTRMVEAMLGFGLGQLDARVGTISGIKELQTLTDSFDAMAERIETSVKLSEVQRAALQESEAKYRRTLDTMLEGCQIIGFDWRYLYINAAAEQHNRRPSTELLGRTVTECWPGIAETEVYACEKRCMEERTTHQVDTQFIFSDGSVGWFRVVVLPVTDGIAIFSEDITARKEAEEEILQLNTGLELRVAERTRKLVAANSELEAFAYSVSHDLRAPLRAVSGFGEILSERYRAGLDAEGQRYLDNVKSAAEHMNHLIDDLLQYSRVGRSAVTVETVDLAPLLQDITMLFQLRLKNGGRIEIAESLALPVGDPHLIEQILTNLIDNALKYQPPGQIPVVRVSAVLEGDSVALRVADNGIGIAPEHREKIFAVFQRLHTEEEYPGTGIGLAIAQKAARLMNGTLTVDSGPASGPGPGSIFTLRLPAARQTSE